MVGYRGTERQIKWAERSSLVLRVVIVLYLLGWVYSLVHAWLADERPREALESFLFGFAFLGALFLAVRRLSDFRRR